LFDEGVEGLEDLNIEGVKFEGSSLFDEGVEGLEDLNIEGVMFVGIEFV